MRKRKLRTFLIVGVLFFLPACGIPRMFPWSEDSQYELTSNSITFYLDFLYQTDEGVQRWPTLEPSENTPVFRIYYYIDDTQNFNSNVSIGSSLRSRFRSRYGSSFPPFFDEGDEVATVTVTTDRDETIEVSAYEVTVVPSGGGDPVPISRVFQGMDYFASAGGSSYIAEYSFRRTSNSGEYYIEMTYNGQTYLLARMNGEPFSDSSPDIYFNPRSGGEPEFLPEDESAFIGNAVGVHLFGAVSFAFEGYTTRQTVLLDDISLN